MSRQAYTGRGLIKLGDRMALYERGFLTKKELEFLKERKDGKSLNEIARLKGVSPMTIWRRKNRVESKVKKAWKTLRILKEYGYKSD